MSEIGRLLVLGGVALIVVGALVWLLGSVLPLGRLPGDVRLGGDNWTVYVPITTSILLSVVLSLILAVALRLFGR